MPLEVGLWRVDDGKPVRLIPSGVPLESQLEDMIEREPTILGTPLMLVGRQVATDFGKYVDLLAVDDDGALHVLELKRDTLAAQVTDEPPNSTSVGDVPLPLDLDMCSSSLGEKSSHPPNRIVPTCRPRPPYRIGRATIMSEQSRHRNNVRCSDVGATDNLNDPHRDRGVNRRRDWLGDGNRIDNPRSSATMLRPRPSRRYLERPLRVPPWPASGRSEYETHPAVGASRPPCRGLGPHVRNVRQGERGEMMSMCRS